MNALPGTPPRLVASDIDGTLVRADQSISARTRAAIEAVEAAGSMFVLVTGRPPRWMAPVAEVTGHRGIAVCANGALVYDLHTETVVREHVLTPEVALEVAELLRAAVPGVGFAVERGVRGFGREGAYVPRWDNGQVQVAPLPELLEGGAVKLLARLEGSSSDDLLARARAAIGHLATTTHSSDDGLLEISALGVSKASALADLAAVDGIGPHESVAFGDMPNDLPMLAWAGHAVAVANAHPEVLVAADEVTASNEDDGVALVLERLFS